MNDEVFNGFMPTVTDVIISKPTASITTNGDLIDVHCITIKTLDKDYVFSMKPSDLQKLYFLILKCML